MLRQLQHKAIGTIQKYINILIEYCIVILCSMNIKAYVVNVTLFKVEIGICQIYIT